MFLRTARLPPFRLARRDLLALAEQTTKQQGLSEQLAQQPGFVAVECRVWCEPLSRHVQVREWLAGEG
jgi:hypothetical protein